MLTVVSKQKQQKGKPSPLWMPSPVYSAVRSTCTYRVMDANPNNPLNSNTEPVSQAFPQVVGDTTPLVCYSTDLLKCWMRYMTARPLWSRVVSVLKVATSKTNNATYISGTSTTDLRCLHVATEAEIDAAAARGELDGVTANEAKMCAFVLLNLFIKTGAPHLRLILPHEVATLGRVPRSDEVSTPSNIVKLARLESMGYMKAALIGADNDKWEQFHSSETARFKYLLGQATGSRATDNSIKSLSDVDKAVYNNHVVSGYSTLMQQLHTLSIGDSGAHKISTGTVVNPALVSLQASAMLGKGTKTNSGSSNNKKYNDMIERYRIATGHKLDAKAEKLQKNLVMRLDELSRMEEQRRIFPMLAFQYNTITGKAEPSMSSLQAMAVLCGTPYVHQQQNQQYAPQALALPSHQIQQSQPAPIQQQQQQAQQVVQRPSYVSVNPIGMNNTTSTLSLGNVQIPSFKPTAVSQPSVASYGVPNQQGYPQQAPSLQQLQQQAQQNQAQQHIYVSPQHVHPQSQQPQVQSPQQPQVQSPQLQQQLQGAQSSQAQTQDPQQVQSSQQVQDNVDGDGDVIEDELVD